MDGKLLVLCGERPTIDENGRRIDEKGQLLTKQGNEYRDIDGNVVQVDEHKKVISGMDLLNPMETEATKLNILYVDWETIIGSGDGEPLQEMKHYAEIVDKLPARITLKGMEEPSLLKKAHWDTLMEIDRYGQRPTHSYKFKAMEQFEKMFSDVMQKNGIVSILLALPVEDGEDVNQRRMKLLRSWNYAQKSLQAPRKVEVLSQLSYTTYGEVYKKAQDEMMKIYEKPGWNQQPGEDEEPGL